MPLVYFETSQLVLVAEINCVGIVGKIGKSIGKHGFSADSDAFGMVFVQLPVAAATFARINSTTNNNFHHQTFFHRKVMIKSYGLKYYRTKNNLLFGSVSRLVIGKSSGNSSEFIGIHRNPSESIGIPTSEDKVIRKNSSNKLFSPRRISNHWILTYLSFEKKVWCRIL